MLNFVTSGRGETMGCLVVYILVNNTICDKVTPDQSNSSIDADLQCTF